MRKILLLLAFIVGPAALGAFTSEASAQITCPKTDTSEAHLSKLKTSCRTTCDDTRKMKHPEDIAGCKKSCDSTYSFCVAKYQEWEKKKVECRKPIAACWDKCPKGRENQKCMDSCSDKLADELGKCSERAMQ